MEEKVQDEVVLEDEMIIEEDAIVESTSEESQASEPISVCKFTFSSSLKDII